MLGGWHDVNMDAEEAGDPACAWPEPSDAGSNADSDDEDFEVHSSAAEASSDSDIDSDEPTPGSEDVRSLELDSGDAQPALCLHVMLAAPDLNRKHNADTQTPMAAGDEGTGGLQLPEMEDILDDADLLSSDEVSQSNTFRHCFLPPKEQHLLHDMRESCMRLYAAGGPHPADAGRHAAPCRGRS